MNNILPLSGGNSATLRAPAELSERQRRPVTRQMAQVSPEGQIALDAAQSLRADDKAEAADRMDVEERKKLQSLVRFSAADIDILNEMNDVSIVAFVKEWTFAKEVTLELVLGLPMQDYDTLREAVAPLAAELFVNFKASRASDSPTAPSSESVMRSEGSTSTDSQVNSELISSSRSA